MKRSERRDAIDALYAQIPDAGCKGLCQEYCGPVVMSREEWQRIKERTGNVVPKSLTCPMLGSDGRCTVYDVRPVICRIWGVAEGLPCPHGCKPERRLSREEAFDLIAQAEAISEGQRACVNPNVEVREVTVFGKPLPVVLVREGAA